MAKPDFTHLHVHSHYSLLNALPKIPDLIDRAQKYELDALALTDDGNLYGAIEFFRECKKAEIKPIIGVDFYVAVRSRHDRQAGVDNRRHRLVLLAKSNTGYKSLLKLVTEAHLTGFYYKPRIDHELMEKYCDGLLAIIPSFSGETTARIKVGDKKGAADILRQYQEWYGSDSVYLELTHHPEIEGHEDLMKDIKKLSEETGVPLVAAHDTYYLDPQDRRARETLISVQGNSGYRANSEEEDFSFITPARAAKLFKKEPEAIANIRKIVEMCNVEIELGNFHFPTPQTDEDYNVKLRKIVEEGIEKRGLERTPEIEERMNYELEIIKSKGYSPYFLVVADLLRYAHENGIPTTIRGSVAGSLVTYLAGITNLNPFDYGLRFERFLNPDRPSAPDIDMDYADSRREEMLEYAKKVYGEHRVAQIGTFGTMMARGAVRDVARALGFPYAKGDQIAKLIPMGSQGFPMTIDRAMKESADLVKLYKSDAEAKEIIDMAKKVEGCARHISIHAAGVVIAPTTLTDFTPLQLDPKGGKIITQYDMYSIEDAGLPKFDFLGLKNLSILANAVKLIEKWRGTTIDIEHIPLDDKKTYDMLSRGETMGLFQLNGSGMTHFLKELRPTTIHDINAMVALYRPGPMDFIPEYIRRKNNPHLVDYPHELLKEDLEKSFGLLIYQEDVMMTAIKLAGYSWLDADKFRKAMGKKIPKLMEEQEEMFKSGCVKNGIERKLADDLWERIKPFAAYAFNKAHAASYGRVAYQTAYLKANYPVEYMTAVLTADQGNVEKIAEAVAECKRMGIEVLPPSINESFTDFTIIEEDSKEMIRFGLCTIKNFGEGIADAIIAERKKNGPFSSLAHFLERVQDRNLNRKSLESLIKSGAMDEFGERGKLFANIDGLIEYSKQARNTDSSQESLFGLMNTSSSLPSLTLQDAPEADKETKLAWEKELLGLYISGHPLDRIREKLEGREQNIQFIVEKLKEGMLAVAAGLIEEHREIRTKRGDLMCFLTISDYTGSIECVAFPKTYEEYRAILAPDQCVVIKGRLSNRNNEKSLIAEVAKKL